MLVDSHCHLHCLDLTNFNQQLDNVIALAKENGVDHLLCVCIELGDYPLLEKIATSYPNVFISVGIHPNVEMHTPVAAELLIELAANPRCIAIGETGLDYYRSLAAEAQEIQRDSFKQHIRAALSSGKPLIIHTRQAAEDTLKVMVEESASDIGGVMHCFAEELTIAQRAIELNFYISFSGIITFKNANALQQVVKQIPLDRILIETDSPYLAPVPFRGKQNHPALVKYVAQTIADLRGISLEEVAEITSENFYRCFKISRVF